MPRVAFWVGNWSGNVPKRASRSLWMKHRKPNSTSAMVLKPIVCSGITMADMQSQMAKPLHSLLKAIMLNSAIIWLAWLVRHGVSRAVIMLLAVPSTCLLIASIAASSISIATLTTRPIWLTSFTHQFSHSQIFKHILSFVISDYSGLISSNLTPEPPKNLKICP